MRTNHPQAKFFCVLATTLALLSTAAAQPMMGPGGGGRGSGPGPMMGPGMMGPGMFGRICGPGAAGFAEWRLDRMEQAIKPTEAQRAKFDEFKAASNKAAETMRSACPTSLPLTVVGQMEAMEKRMEAMLQAVKSVRPALEAFYATLSEEQKAQLNGASTARRLWRWRDRW